LLTQSQKSKIEKITHLHPLCKLLIAVSISILSLLISFSYEMDPLLRIMICWDVFAFCYLTISWITFRYVSTDRIRYVAKNQDSSHRVIFIILFLATIFSLIVIFLLLKSRGEWDLNKGLVAFIYLLGIFFSWMLLHTIYTFHYAHLYYGKDKGKETKADEGGLRFPGKDLNYDKNPNYIDFAYFSFVIGMTFQVSDVTIDSRRIRGNVLFHSLLSFGFNVVIISICVNAIVNI